MAQCPPPKYASGCGHLRDIAGLVQTRPSHGNLCATPNLINFEITNATYLCLAVKHRTVFRLLMQAPHRTSASAKINTN